MKIIGMFGLLTQMKKQTKFKLKNIKNNKNIKVKIIKYEV
jgi:hypothetical protein